jgi:hypothetical protein
VPAGRSGTAVRENHGLTDFGLHARKQKTQSNSQLLRSVNLHPAQKFEHEDNSYASADERR